MGRQTGFDKFLDVFFQGRIRGELRIQNDKGLDDFSPHFVRTADYPGHGHGRVLDQAVFYFRRADPITRAGDQIILSANKPEITLVILSSQISGQAPVPSKFSFRGAGVIPVPQKHNRIRPKDGHLTDHSRGQHLT